MRQGIWVDLMKLVAGFVLLWAAFAYVPDILPENWKPDLFNGSESIQVSIEQEERLGEFMFELFMEDYDEILDPKVDSAMWVIESRLLKNIGLTEYEYNIMVVDDPMINAMTMPGGNIVVFSGLIEFCETPEELASVLAHEIGHVEQRHVVEKLVTELGLTFVIAVITGGDATLIHELSRTLISGVFSRSQEADADDYGMKLMLKSGVDPRSLAAFFRKLNRENLAYNEYLEWLMSHPHNNARIKTSLEFEVPDSFVSKPFNINWTHVQNAL